MLVTTALAALAFGSALSAATPGASTLPPMPVGVSASESISPTLVARVLEETDAVWRAAGLVFAWRREPDGSDPRTVAARAIERRPTIAPTLRVVIASGRSADAQKRSTDVTALGWIRFDNGAPAPEVYISFDNAVEYLVGARAVVGLVDRMPIAEREMLLARAMGRALAHEIGHYVLASKQHAARGLMRATHTASEFFSFERSAFLVDAAQRQIVIDRLRRTTSLAMHDPR